MESEVPSLGEMSTQDSIEAHEADDKPQKDDSHLPDAHNGVVIEEETEIPKQAKLPGILYRVCCTEDDKSGMVFYSDVPLKESDGVFKPTISATPAQKLPSIMVALSVRGKEISGSVGDVKAFHGFKTVPATHSGRGFEPASSNKSPIVLNSQSMTTVLRRVIKYYPSQTLTGNQIKIQHPYRSLLHYYDELEAVKDACTGKSNPKYENCQQYLSKLRIPETMQNGATALQIETILNYVRLNHETEIRPELRLYNQEQPLATYEMLWLLFKPGTDVYALSNGRLAVFVVQEINHKEKVKISDPRRRRDLHNRWVISVWHLALTLSGKIQRRRQKFRIREFEGERAITSLRIYPCQYLDANDGGATRMQCEKTGSHYFEITKNLPLHSNYDGQTSILDFEMVDPLARKENRQDGATWYQGQVMIDPKGYHGFRDLLRRTIRRPDLDADSENENEVDMDTDQEPNDLGGGETWAEYNDIDPKTQPHLSKHHYFLLPSQIEGFNLKSKSWAMLSIDSIRNIEWPSETDNALSNLVLSPERDDISILKALSRKKGSLRKETIWAADPIKGKGEGQAFLLHGPPGTGKTYTVECMAEYTRRPLVSLTVSDFIPTRLSLEKELMKWFSLAESWQAIVLIDEADIFLERRSSNANSVAKNGLVSVFLRTMEYFSGMLFLTTNRVGEIDDAFLSRIQVAIGYETLTETARNQIWNNFFQRLKKERSDITVTERSKIFLRSDETLRKLELNGREIRNALQTAIALATYDADSHSPDGTASYIEVQPDHFQRVIERRRMFVQDTDSIRNMTLEERALSEGIRRDRNLK